MKRHPYHCSWKLVYPLALALFAGLVGGAVMINNNHSVGDQLRVYRIAVAATGEFTAFHGGTKADALTAIKAIIDEANKVYEKELAIRLELVSDAQQNSIIYTSSGSDPYTPGNRPAQLNENQSNLDTEIGTANYDIGHVIGMVNNNAGGQAGLGVVGDTNRKAKGVSETSNPSASSTGFMGVFIHELGHQFGAEHTFNANAVGSCIGNREGSNAYEPASGSTIMSYAGICGSDNIVSQEDLYFHAASFEQINEYIENNLDAAPYSSTSSGNTMPTVDGGADFVIPANTPFELTATGSDADNDSLTYTWEQVDTGNAMGLPLFDNGFSPLFRSFPPTENPTRTFPRLTDLLANTLSSGEVLPNSSRDLNFRVTVRDNNAAAGGVFSNDVYLDVRNTGAAFAVAYPNGGESVVGGTSMSVTWAVAGTDANGIDASQVDIRLSTNGGESFPFLIATVDNNGSTSITVPNIDTSRARLKIQGAGNIFFDVSNNDFTITSDPAVAGISIMETDGSTIATESSLIDSYEVALNTAPGSAVTVSATSDDQTELSTDGATYSSSVSLTFNSTSSQTVFVRAIDDAVVEGGHSSAITHTVTTGDGGSYPPSLLVNEVMAQIVDDESLAVVGIDFDLSVSHPSPDLWTTFQVAASFDPQVISNMMRDDGIATSIDLTLNYDSGSLSTGRSTAGAGSFTKPAHVPDLEEIDGFHRGTLPLSATWSDLVPGRLYGIYVFGLDGDDTRALGQMVTITGVTTLPTFTQALVDGDLQVNDQTGSSSQDLSFFEEVVEADANGEILVRMVPTGDGLGLAGMAVREILPSTPGISIANQAGVTEGGSSATYQINLNTDPNGTVIVAVDADADTEVSLDGINFASTQFLTVSNTLPQTIAVRAIEDALVEGSHTSSISNTITSSTSAMYPVGLSLDTAFVSVADNDLFAPLAGVDLDRGSTSPNNWGIATTLYETLTNLTLEDGSSTTIDLIIDNGFQGISYGNSSPSVATTPTHTQSLSAVDYTLLQGANSGPVTFSWGQLSPSMSYNVYLFAVENFGVDINQTVSVSGAGAPTVFTQSTTTNTELWINGQKGDDLPLESFAVPVTSSPTGTITATVTANAGVSWVVLSGVAIQEAPTSYGITVDAGDGITVAEESGTDTYTIALDSTPTAAVEITVTADSQSEISLDGSTFAASRVFYRSDTSPQTVTVRAVDDAIDEPLHSSRISHAVTASGDTANYPLSTFIGPVTAVIEDNESLVSIVANDASGAEPSDDAQFTVSLGAGDVAPAGGVSINFSVSGSAANGSDFAMVNSPITISAGSNSATVSIDVSDDGESELPETVVITLDSTSNPGITVASSPDDAAIAVITSDELTGFQAWQLANFTQSSVTNMAEQATLWGAVADPDNDGILNLAEYFHNLAPMTSNVSPVTSSVVDVADVDYLQMVFRRRRSLSDVQQTVQQGPTPASADWQPAPTAIETTVIIDGDTEEVTVRYPFGSQVRRFIRFLIETN